jgi:GH24 family phage-related lysozyme (muramidase)
MTIVNRATLDLIKQFEGCKLTAYKDIAGIWTIGYGTTAAAGLGIEPSKGMTITQERAEDLLRRGVDKFAAQVDALITTKVNQNQRGAIICLAYNIGVGALSKSTVLRELNAGNKDKAAAAFQMWNKAGGEIVQGLVRRREAERQLFLTPVAADMHNVPDQVETKSIWFTIINAIVALFKGSKK